MSEDTQLSGISRDELIEMLLKNFTKLSDMDQKIFGLGPLTLALSAGFGGVIFNHLYRVPLHIKLGGFATNLPLFGMSFITTTVLYSGAVSTPLLAGDLYDSSSCITRGALIGAVGGGLYPWCMAVPLNFFFAGRYNTAPVPTARHVIPYAVQLTRPILKKIVPVVLLQGMFGGYLASKTFQVYIKLDRLTFGEEEYHD